MLSFTRHPPVGSTALGQNHHVIASRKAWQSALPCLPHRGGKKSKQKHRVPTMLSLRGHKPVAISCHRSANLYDVPGDCHVACRLLAMSGSWKLIFLLMHGNHPPKKHDSITKKPPGKFRAVRLIFYNNRACSRGIWGSRNRAPCRRWGTSSGAFPRG